MRRVILTILAACVAAAGLGVHAAAPDGFVSDATADALYAVLIFLIVAFLAPRWPSWAPGAIALAWCVAVELFQLTGVPERWGIAFRPLMLVFGTVFSWWDLAAYAVGIVVVAAFDTIVRAAVRGRRAEEPISSPARDR